MSFVRHCERSEAIQLRRSKERLFRRFAPPNDTETCVLIPAARFSPGFCNLMSLSRRERAQGKPGADCARSTVCNGGERNAHGFDRYSRDIPAFPAQWFYGLYVLSPVSGGFCHRCRPHTGGADRRHGRGARTTRLRRTLRTFRPASKTRLTPQRPSHPAPTCRDDRDTSPRGRDTAHILPIYRIVK